MPIIFENDNDVIIYALEKIISFAKENHYLFVANCAWWIAGIIGLDSGLTNYIDNIRNHQLIRQQEEFYNSPRAISATPRDIARGVSPEENTESAPKVLRTTRQGKVNPLPKSKRQLKRARRAEEKRKANLSKE
jgi:hypothetical protein